MNYRLVFRLLLASLVIFSIMCCTKTRKVSIKHAYNELDGGDAIPWEYVVTFKPEVTEQQKATFETEFAKYLTDYANNSLKDGNQNNNGLVLRDSFNSVSIWFNRTDCYCGGLPVLYSGLIQAEESIVSGSSGTDDDDPTPNQDSCFIEESIADGSSGSDFSGLQPEESELDSLPENQGWDDYVDDISYNKFIRPINGNDQDDWTTAGTKAPVKSLKEGDVVIAIVDSGMKGSLHNYYTEQGKAWYGEFDLGCDGVKDTVWGYDFISNETIPKDDLLHGTKVAAIIDSTMDDQNNCAVQYMVVRIFGECYGSEFHAACGIRFAVDNGADIINTSWGMSSQSELINQAVEYANNQSVYVVASNGNEAKILDLNDELHCPSDLAYGPDNKLPYVLPVAGLEDGSTDVWGWEMTSVGGVDLLSNDRTTGSNLYPNRINHAESSVYDLSIKIRITDGWHEAYEGRVTGTSFAAPQVTGKLANYLCCFGATRCTPDNFRGMFSNQVNSDLVEVEDGSVLPLNLIQLKEIGIKDCIR